MKTIWKFKLEIEKLQKLEMPKKAEIIAVKTQNETPFLWAVVDTEAQKETRTFEIVPTGSAIESKKHDYLSSLFYMKDSLVQHVFEVFD